MKKTLLLTSCLLTLAACSEIPSGAYFNRGDPENLLDVSTEVVNLTLSPASISELTNLVQKDPPSRAELGCNASDARCSQAKKLLDSHNVPSQFTGGNTGIALVYERVIARDCQQRYIDNSINPYNLAHPTSGCSVTANTVQQVSDKREFVNPALMDLPDGEKAVQNYRSYLKPPKGPSNTTSSPLVSSSSVGTN